MSEPISIIVTVATISIIVLIGLGVLIGETIHEKIKLKQSNDDYASSQFRKRAFNKKI